MPHSEWLGEHGGTSMARFDIVCVHTIVGYAPAHAAHFSTRADGWIGQSRDTSFRSAANLNGNHRIIAIENEDHGGAYGGWNTGDGRAVPGFTAAQMESIAHILVFCHRAHGIPLVPCPDSRPGSRGIAYHRQGCDGNFAGYAYPGRVSGGELWSSAGGKVCPGDRRISQLLNIIIPRARVIAGLDAPPKEPEVELTDEVVWGDGHRVKVKDIFAEVYIAARGLRGASAFDGQPDIVQLPPLVGIRSAVDGLSDDESRVIAAVQGAKGELLLALAGIDGTPSDDQVADLADKLNAQLGGDYNVTISRTNPA
jgi:hypothetical protein